jgi:hypothetical protein
MVVLKKRLPTFLKVLSVYPDIFKAKLKLL